MKEWEVIMSSAKCLERMKALELHEHEFNCRLTGGICNYDNCPKKSGPED